MDNKISIGTKAELVQFWGFSVANPPKLKKHGFWISLLLLAVIVASIRSVFYTVRLIPKRTDL